MSDSTTLLEQIDGSQAQHEVTANNLFDASSPSAAYGRHAEACAGLTWGYYGTRYGGTAVANGTNACGASTTTYMVVNLSTGAVSFSTATTNWNDSVNYARCYKIVTGTSSVTSYEDHRFGPLGVIAGAAIAGAGDMLLAGVQTVTGAKTFGSAGAVGKLKVAGNTSGEITLDAAAVAGTNTLTLPAETDTLATQGHVANAVAAAVAGLSWKQAVRAATTAALTLATDVENGDTIDGVTLATGDRILIKNQAAAAENGIYVVAASGAPARASDANSGAELVNASVYVSEGTTLADTQWTCTTNATIVPDTTALAFAQLTSGGGITELTGDVTASGTGSVAATIANDSVSYAKMQNVSATSRVLGRKTAGSGDTEECSLSEVLDFIGSAAQGDILYRGASAWARLAAGTSGQFLKTLGTGANPAWAGVTAGKHAMFISAAAMRPSATGGCAAIAAVATSANHPDILSLDFDTTTEEYAQFSIVMPKSWDEGTITFKAHWSHASTTTNFGVAWKLQAVAISDDDTIDAAYGTAVAVTDTGGTTSDLYTTSESSAITVAGSPAAEDLVAFRVFREPSNGSDTMAIDARLHGITVYITTDAETDA